jgi:hypothetical protein
MEQADVTKNAVTYRARETGSLPEVAAVTATGVLSATPAIV